MKYRFTYSKLLPKKTLVPICLEIHVYLRESVGCEFTFKGV